MTQMNADKTPAQGLFMRICLSGAIDVDVGILSALLREICVIRDSEDKTRLSASSVILNPNFWHTRTAGLEFHPEITRVFRRL